MVRLPIEALTQETAKAVAAPYLLDIKATKTHWIITWSLEESENYDRFGMEDGRGWMARLAPVRDELMRGDLRSLYIGWLAAVAGEMMDDDDVEPLSVGGLASLTAAQQALAEFLEVDPDLLAGAGMGSPAEQETEVSQREMEKWIDGPNGPSGTGSHHGGAAYRRAIPTHPGVRWENCGRTPKRPDKFGWKNKDGTESNGRSSDVRNARRI